MDKNRILRYLDNMKEDIIALPDDEKTSIVAKLIIGDFWGEKDIHGFGFSIGQPSDIAVVLATIINDMFDFKDPEQRTMFFKSLDELSSQMVHETKEKESEKTYPKEILDDGLN